MPHFQTARGALITTSSAPSLQVMHHRSAGEALLDAHQQKVLARMRALSLKAREWQEKHDKQVQANEKLVKELEAFRVLYELESQRRKALESELGRVVRLASSSASSSSPSKAAAVEPFSPSVWASQRNTRSHRSQQVDPTSHGLVLRAQTSPTGGGSSSSCVVEEDVCEEQKETIIVETQDRKAAALECAPVDDKASDDKCCDDEDEKEDGFTPLVERLVVAGVSDGKLLQWLNKRRQKEREREKARAAAAWSEAAERDKKAQAANANAGRRRRKWSAGRGSKEKVTPPPPAAADTEANTPAAAAAAFLVGTEEEEEEEVHAEVLAAFPGEGDNGCFTGLPNGLADFCLPRGVQVKEVSAGASMSDVYQALFGSGNIGRHKGCFVFALLRDEKEGLNADMSPLWGVCIIHPGVRRYYVQADGSLSTFQDLSLAGEAGANYVDVVVPRSYCILTRCPFFFLHLRVLSGLLEADRLTKVFEMASLGAQDSSLCRGLNLALVERVARGCSRLPRPRPGRAITLDLLDDDDDSSDGAGGYENGLLLLDPIDLTMAETEGPAGEQGLPRSVGAEGRRLMALVEWNLPLLLHRVPLKTVTQTVGLLLCEMQVVVVCEDLALLSACTLGLSLLLRPMRWVGTLVPVLPAKYDPLLDAPVPFLVGLPSMTDSLHSRKGLAILDLNSGALRVHAADARDGRLEPSLLLPGLHGLNEALREEKAKLSSSLSKAASVVTNMDGSVKQQQDEYELKPVHLACARACQSIVQAHVESVISMAHTHSVPHEAAPFIDRFRKTQLWSVHTEGLNSVVAEE